MSATTPPFLFISANGFASSPFKRITTLCVVYRNRCCDTFKSITKCVWFCLMSRQALASVQSLNQRASEQVMSSRRIPCFGGADCPLVDDLDHDNVRIIVTTLSDPLVD